MREVESELQEAGFRMLDMKPAHIVVRFTKSGQLLRRKNGRLAYALIDYELLEHTGASGICRSARNVLNCGWYSALRP